MIEKNARKTQLTLHRTFINKFIKNNYKKRRENSFIKLQSRYIKFSIKNLFLQK